MNYEDQFKPYTPEIRGDLVEYLRGCEFHRISNLFNGPKYFLEMREKGLLIPRISFIRVNQSPIPDIGYIVNNELLLESDGPGRYNMSMMFAENGVYTPEQALTGNNWSIDWLNLHPQTIKTPTTEQ